MRKALMAILMAATAATPVAAAPEGRWSRESRGGDEVARAERIQQRQEARQQRSEAQDGRQARAVERQQRFEARRQVEAQRQAPVQPQAEGQHAWRNRGGAQWQGRDRRNEGQEAYRRPIEVNREAARAGQEAQSSRSRRWGERSPGAYEQQRRQEWRGDDRRGDRQVNRDRRWSDNRSGGWNDGRRDRHRNWNHDWRSDNRYDWQRWRSSNRNLFRGAPYYSPYRNYSYRRLSIGLILDSLFYSQRYWIGDPWQYRLPPAPYGTQWVRYWDDALLVDVYTGEVIDVIYGFFW